MDHSIENLFCLKQLLESEFGEHYPIDIVYLIIIIYRYLIKIKISCGSNHNLLLRNTYVYSWGSNTDRQLGIGKGNSFNYPKLIDNLEDVTEISCGSHHSMAVESNGKAYTWGFNQLDQLGLGDYKNRKFPCGVFMLDPVTKVYCGGDHSFAITALNRIYSWGYNGCGQLGLGDYMCRSMPTLMENDILKNLLEINCGYNHCMALMDDAIYGWGENTSGQLGLGDMLDRNLPCKIDLVRIVKISCGFDHSMALSVDGIVYVCGSNPKKLDLKNVIDISCRWHHSFFLTKCGKIYGWGNNTCGQLGLGHSENQSEPVQLTNIPKYVEKIYCGYQHSIIVTALQEIYVCGENVHGQLGLGHNENRNVFQQLKF